jgi:hypothetical protein
MRKWLSRSQIRQRPGLAVATVSLVIITAVTVIFSFGWLSSRSDDRVAVIANFLSLGTFLLALAAGIIALAAYSAATGLTTLKLQFRLPSGHPNEVTFFVSKEPFSPVPPLGSEFTASASILVTNTSHYAARSPAVIIEFRGARIRTDLYKYTGAREPIVRDPDTGDVLALQWDGGAALLDSR